MRRVLRWLRVPAALVVIPTAAAEVSGQAVVAVIVVCVMVAVLVIAALCWIVADVGRSGNLAALLTAAHGRRELPVPAAELALPAVTEAASGPLPPLD